MAQVVSFTHSVAATPQHNISYVLHGTSTPNWTARSVAGILVDAMEKNPQTVPIIIQLLHCQFPQYIRVSSGGVDQAGTIRAYFDKVETISRANDLLVYFTAIANGENMTKVVPKFANALLAKFEALKSEEMAAWRPFQETAMKLKSSCEETKYWNTPKSIAMDTLLHVMSYLPVPTLFNICRVCKEWYRLIAKCSGSHQSLITKVEYDAMPKKFEIMPLLSRCGHTIVELVDFDLDSGSWYVH